MCYLELLSTRYNLEVKTWATLLRSAHFLHFSLNPKFLKIRREPKRRALRLCSCPDMASDTVYSRLEVEDLIARGNKIVIVDGHVLKVDHWIPYHPGGEKAIYHMVGRDASEEVNALHSSEARTKMLSFRIGRIEGRWQNFLPPIQGGSFRAFNHNLSNEHSESRTLVTNTISHRQSQTSSLLEEAADEANKSHSNDGLGRPKAGICSTNSNVEKHGRSEMAAYQAAKGVLQSRTQEQIDHDLAKYPALSDDTQDNIVQRYRELEHVIQARGLYKCSYSSYAIEMLRYLSLLGMSLLCLRFGYYTTGGLFMGCLWHQLVFTVHDAGHMGITHDFQLDTTIGMFIASYIGGLSLGWWKRNHNVHHITTNSPEHDPDIEHMPFFAISHRFFESLWSSYYDRIMSYDMVAQRVIRYQHILYYPILLFGRFNLYFLSWEFLLRGQGPRKGSAWWHRYFELLGQVFFWTWYGYGIIYKSIATPWGRFAFIMASHMVTAPLHVQITLSHFSMSTADLGVNESFPQRMLRTTMDVDCPEWLDFFHGGLQFQAIHHLFPRVPRHNLRETQKLVKEFCEDVGIPYVRYGFVQGNKEVISRLGEIGKQAAVFAECQRSISSKNLLILTDQKSVLSARK